MNFGRDARAFAAALIVSVLATGISAANAATYTWSGPGSDFDTAANWTPATVPGSGDTALFAGALPTTIGTGGFSLDTLQVNSGAYIFNLDAAFGQFSGLGIVNNSATAPVFNLTPGAMTFANSASAGDSRINGAAGSLMSFADSSSAGTARIGADATLVQFVDSATAAGAIITATNGAAISFQGTTTAATASLTATDSQVFFAEGSTAGNATLTINNGALLVFIDGATGGNAAITANGSGVVDFSGGTGPNNDGKLSAGSIAGTGSFYLGSNLITVGANNASTTVSGTISDCGPGGTACLAYCGCFAITNGALLKTGTGVLTLTGSNTFTGGIGIYQGIVNAGADANLGAATGEIAFNGGTLQWGAAFNLSAARTLALKAGGGTFDTNGFTTIISQGISGAGALTKAGAGTLILTGFNTYGATVISAGTLQLGNGGTNGGPGGGAVTDNGTLAFARTDAGALLFGNAISGTGGLTLTTANTATIQLAGTNSYSGPTNILGGKLLLTNPAAIAAASTYNVAGGAVLDLAGSASLANLTGAGTVLIDQSDPVPVLNLSLTNANFTGTISQNSGRANTVTVLTGGNVILAGGNNWTGGTTINAGGTLTIGNGGTGGNVPSGPITNNGTFVFNHADNLTFAGVFSGNGAVTQAGAGTLSLTGSNTFTGVTTVNAGILSVNGSSASPVTVNNGGKLQGTGSVGGIVANNGGTVAPGNSIGTLTVNGTVAFNAGSTYTAELSPAASDRIVASGAVTINSGATLALVPAAGTYVSGTDYVLITGSSVTGGFGTVTGTVAGFTNTIQYSATAVDLILSPVPPPATPAPITTFLFASYGRTPNQIAAGTALAAASPGGALYGALGNVVKANTAAVPGTLGLLAGDIHASIRSAAIEDSRVIRDTVMNRLDRASPGTDASDTGLWSSLFGSYGSIAGDGNAAALHHDASGILIGADTQATENLRLGAVLAYNSTNAATSDRLSTATGNIATILAYGGYGDGALDLKAGAAYSFGTLHTARSIPVMAYSDSGKQSQHGSQVFFTGGWKFTAQDRVVEPYLGIAAIQAGSGAFVEIGDAGALSGASKSDSQTYSTLGVKAALDGLTLGNGMPVTPKIDLGWQHAFNTLRPGQTVTFQNAAQSFTVLGVPLATDAAALQLGVALTLAPDMVLDAGYDGSFSSRVQNNALRVGLGIQL